MSNQEPFMFLAFGSFFILLGLIQAYLRKVWLRGGGWFYRDKQPIRYWLTIVSYLLCGLLAVAFGLFEFHALPH
jgi:hypothetical protein